MLDRHLDRALEVMAEMCGAPSFGELDAEREVVLEEIAMYEDDPQDKVFDVLGEAVFGAHPLGRAVIGKPTSSAGAVTARAARLSRRALCAANLVVAAAGSVDHDELVALVLLAGGARAAPSRRGARRARAAVARTVGS